MKKAFLYLTLLFSLIVCAQNEQLALHYYEKGQFENLRQCRQGALKQSLGRRPSSGKRRSCHESTCIGKEDLPQLQDY